MKQPDSFAVNSSGPVYDWANQWAWNVYVANELISHLRRLKTLRKVQARFWRPGLASAVKDYDAACLTFQDGKTFCARFCARLIAGSRRAVLTLKKAQQRQKDCFDKGVETCQYAPGDLVFLFNPQVKTGEAAKFHGERKGRYEVLERTIEVNYRIKTPSDPGSRSKVIHFNNLKLYQCKRGEF
ncbi:unnamed protein product, partial [Porites lobata]